MKLVLTMLLAACAVVTFAACGGGNNAAVANTTANANNAGHHEEEEVQTSLGKGKLLGLEFEVLQNGEARKGKAVDIDMAPVGGKAAAEKYTIYSYFAGEDGKDDGKDKITWNDEDGAVCSNVMVPKDPKGKLMIWFVVKDKDGKEDKAGFEVKPLD